MEYLLNYETVERNSSLLKGRVFTELQLEILKKRLRKKALSSNERTYYYKYIRPKINAMSSLFDLNEMNVYGREHMIDERIKAASKLLDRMKHKHKGKKMLLSGSFLFNKKYNDIDVFVFTRYKKEDYRKGKLHVNFLPEESMDSLFFASLSRISVSNFPITIKDDFKVSIDDILNDYEMLINSMLNDEDIEKELRDFLLKLEYLGKKVILSPKQLYDLKNILKSCSLSNFISDMLINALVLGYDMPLLRKKLIPLVKEYEKLGKEYRAKNIPVYLEAYNKVLSV